MAPLMPARVPEVPAPRRPARLRWTAVVAAALTALVVAPLTAAAANRTTVQLLDEQGEPDGSARLVEVEAVDFEAETVQLRDESGERREVSFSRIDVDHLYNVLAEELRQREAEASGSAERQALAYAHLVVARVCLSRDRLGSAERHLQQAERFDRSLAPAVEAERRLLAELAADTLRRRAQEEREAGEFARARSSLEQVQRRYPDTAAAQAVPALLERLAQLEAARDGGSGRSRRDRERDAGRGADALQAVRDRLAQAESLRLQGHEQLATPDSRGMTTWRRALETLEGRSNGALARLESAVAADTDGRLDEATVADLRVRIRALRLHLYKAKLHYTLYHGQLQTANDLLQRALEIDPEDRELLHLGVLYHSGVRWQRGHQTFDKPEPEPEPEPVDPNPRESDDTSDSDDDDDDEGSSADER